MLDTFCNSILQMSIGQTGENKWVDHNERCRIICSNQVLAVLRVDRPELSSVEKRETRLNDKGHTA